jgi:L-asparaginase II
MPPSPLHCDCSGKHTGMLAASLHLGYPVDNYLDPAHPLQQQIKGLIAEVCQLPESALQMATDGCSLPTFGAPLRAFATAYATLAALAGPHGNALARLRSAMTAHPENVAGEGDLVTDLMLLSGGAVVAKTGAEGLLCMAIPSRGLGIAIRISDGSFRAHPVIAASVLEQLNLVSSSVTAGILDRHSPQLRNHNGWLVGEMRPVFHLTSSAAA